MKINDILEELDSKVGCPGWHLYTKIRGIYGYEMFDADMIATAVFDGAISKEEGKTLYDYCNIGGQRSWKG